MEGNSCELRASHQRIGQKQQQSRNVSNPKHVKREGKKQQTLGSSPARFMLFIAIKWEHYEHLQLSGNYLVTGAVRCY